MDRYYLDEEQICLEAENSRSQKEFQYIVFRTALRFCKEKNKKEIQLKKGYVLIGDDNSKNIYWPLGKVETIYPGKDNRTHMVQV